MNTPSEEQAWRADTYALLARLLAAPPDSELLERLGTLESEGDTAMERALTTLARAARATDARSVAEEYQALFVGVTHGELMPYGSWYLAGFLMEKPLASLREDLHLLGLARQDGVTEPEDHAAALLEAMALLAAAADLRQWAFAREHVFSWLPRFFRDLNQAPAAVFYRTVAGFGAGFLDTEQGLFELENHPD